MDIDVYVEVDVGTELYVAWGCPELPKVLEYALNHIGIINMILGYIPQSRVFGSSGSIIVITSHYKAPK